MTDLINRARKEWCETHVAKDGAPDGHAWQYMQPCPPEVVAALLDVLNTARQGVDPYDRRSHVGQAAEAAITRALKEAGATAPSIAC